METRVPFMETRVPFMGMFVLFMEAALTCVVRSAAREACWERGARQEGTTIPPIILHACYAMSGTVDLYDATNVVHTDIGTGVGHTAPTYLLRDALVLTCPMLYQAREVEEALGAVDQELGQGRFAEARAALEKAKPVAEKHADVVPDARERVRALEDRIDEGEMRAEARQRGGQSLAAAQGALGERRFAEAREALEVARGHYAEGCSAISLRPIPLPPYAQLRYQPTPNSATTLRAAPISIHPTPLPPYAQLCYQSSPDSAITLHYTPRSLYRQLCYNPTCSSALTLRPTPL
eukprot:2803734-Rhodomonas_salina.3